MTCSILNTLTETIVGASIRDVANGRAHQQPVHGIALESQRAHGRQKSVHIVLKGRRYPAVDMLGRQAEVVIVCTLDTARDGPRPRFLREQAAVMRIGECSPSGAVIVSKFPEFGW